MQTKLLFLFFCCLFKSNVALKPNLIEGNWLSEDKKLLIHCYKTVNGKYHGKIVWFARKFTDTSDVADCSLPINKWLGTDVMFNFSFDDDEWNGGQIKDLRTCKSYDAYIKIENENTLKATGYFYFRVFGETLVYKRYTLPIPEMYHNLR